MYIFISYSRGDGTGIAEHVYQYLKKDEHDIFIDTKKIEGGKIWNNEIKTNISNCDIFLIICTPDAIKSPRVKEEVEYAKEADKRIIPCLYKKYVEVSDINWDLDQIQAIEFFDKYELVLELRRLLAGIKSQMPKDFVQEPKPAKTISKNEKQTTTTNTFSLDWYIKRGKDFEEIGRYNEALAMYNNAIKLAPYNFELLFKKVVLLGKVKRFDDALQTLEEAIVLEPKNKDIWYYKGIFLEEMKKYEDALDAIETSLRIELTGPDALNSKLRILEHLGKDEDALDTIEKILSLDKDNVNVLTSKGKIFIKLKRYRDSLKVFESILTLDPENSDALYNKAEILLKLEEYDDALKYYNKIAKEVKPSQENEHIREILESILVLKSYYNNFPSLVQEYIKRDGDIDSITQQFSNVIDWLKTKKEDGEILESSSKNNKITDNNNTIKSISSLGQILEQESHNLRLKEKNSFISTLPDKIDKQLVFAQQIHIRATDLGQNEMIEKSREYLQANNRSFFDILWARVKDKSALIRTLEDHSSFVSSVAVTPDGTKIVSGSWDNTIKVWDIASGGGRLVNTLEGHSSPVNSVAVTPDGTKIVSGSWDNTIKVWDIASGGRLVNTLEGHSSGVNSVAVTPDSTKVVSGSRDNTIKVWDIASGGHLLNTLQGHHDSVNSVAVTPDGTKIVSGSRDNTIKVWDIASGGRLVNTLEGHSSYVYSVAVTPDGTKIVSGSWDKTIKVWDIASGGRLVNTLEGHSSGVNSVAVTPDGTKIVSGSRDNTIKVWDLNNGSNIFASKFDFPISAIAISNNKNVMAIGDSNGGVYALNIV